jgi:hypothetical protein
LPDILRSLFRSKPSPKRWSGCWVARPESRVCYCNNGLIKGGELGRTLSDGRFAGSCSSALYFIIYNPTLSFDFRPIMQDIYITDLNYNNCIYHSTNGRWII